LTEKDVKDDKDAKDNPRFHLSLLSLQSLASLVFLPGPGIAKACPEVSEGGEEIAP